MSKVGEGLSIKEGMLCDMEDVVEVLDRAHVAGEDRALVIDTLKDAFRQWAYGYALTFACMDYIRDAYGMTTSELLDRLDERGEIEAHFVQMYHEKEWGRYEREL